MICQNCGNSVGENAKFCVKCGAALQDRQSAAAAMLVKKVSKKEYFATLRSTKAKRLVMASWVAWGVSGGLLLYTVMRAVFNAFSAMDAFMGHSLFIYFGTRAVIRLLLIVVGGFACKKKSVPLSVVFLIATLDSVLVHLVGVPRSLFLFAALRLICECICLVAAICILIFNIIVNKEYKRYVKLADAK